MLVIRVLVLLKSLMACVAISGVIITTRSHGYWYNKLKDNTKSAKIDLSCSNGFFVAKLAENPTWPTYYTFPKGG